MPARIAVIGAGIFGLAGALELRRRGHRVVVVDPDPIAHISAESNDTSRIVRVDYGGNDELVRLAETALDGWRRWQARWRTPRFHETGLLILTTRPFAEGGYEHASFHLLSSRGHLVERLDASALRARDPSWRHDAPLEGYFNPAGGWVDAGSVLRILTSELRARGVSFVTGHATALRPIGRRAMTVALADGVVLSCDRVVVAAGAWSPQLVPALAAHVRAYAVPVFHLGPTDLVSSAFPPFTIDTATGGYYGVLHTSNRLLKISHNAEGRPVEPGALALRVERGDRVALRGFLARHLPAFVDAPIHRARMCTYSTTVSERFVIAATPDQPAIIVASGGSGHGFKFAPVLGPLIADAALGTGPATFPWPR